MAMAAAIQNGLQIIATTAFAVLFLGLGSYLGARPSVDPQQELAALRTEIDLLRKQQELAPAGTAGIAPPVSITRSTPPSSPM